MGMDEETIQDMIRKRAYELHEQRGGEHGRDLEDWLEAERTVRAGMRKRNKEARSQNEEKKDTALLTPNSNYNSKKVR
jgi:hypothetical protein